MGHGRTRGVSEGRLNGRHEGRGSLLWHLQQQGLASGLTAGVFEDHVRAPPPRAPPPHTAQRVTRKHRRGPVCERKPV